jgi:hypothetical protein
MLPSPQEHQANQSLEKQKHLSSGLVLTNQLTIHLSILPSIHPPTYLPNYTELFLLKPPVAQLSKNSPAFYGTWRSVTVFARARNWSLSWARLIQSMFSQPISLRSILMLSSHLRVVFLVFLLTFPPKSYMHPSSPASYMPCPTHSPWHLVKSKIYDAPSCAVLSSFLLFHPSFIPIISSAPCSQIFSAYVVLPLIFTDHVSNPYKNTGKFIFVYILFFTFSNSRREDKRSETLCNIS